MSINQRNGRRLGISIIILVLLILLGRGMCNRANGQDIQNDTVLLLDTAIISTDEVTDTIKVDTLQSHISIGMRTDILRWEPGVDIGVHYGIFATYITWTPFTMGFGPRVDIGPLYLSATTGRGGVIKGFELKYHVKLTAGVMIPVYVNDMDWRYSLTVGFNYHILGVKSSDDSALNKDIFIPYSFEFGLTTDFGKYERVRK